VPIIFSDVPGYVAVSACTSRASISGRYSSAASLGRSAALASANARHALPLPGYLTTLSEVS
jgi:hypothetical protein